MKIYKVNILKIGILSLFLAGALIASLTDAVHETAHIQQLNNQEGYTNKTIQKMYEGSLVKSNVKDRIIIRPHYRLVERNALAMM